MDEKVLFDLVKCQKVLQNFSRHLSEAGEEKAAEAIQSVIKFLPQFTQ